MVADGDRHGAPPDRGMARTLLLHVVYAGYCALAGAVAGGMAVFAFLVTASAYWRER